MTEKLHQLFIQERDGDLIPTEEFITVSDWEETKFCFAPETLYEHTQFNAFKQITPTTKQWIRIQTFSLI